MATWTTAQAEAAKIVRCDKVDNGGTYKHRVIRVSHASYEDVEWIDTNLAEGATAAQVEAEIVSYLATQEKVNKIVKDTFTDEGVNGTLVADLS